MIDFVALALYSALMGSTPGPNNVMLTASGVNFGFVKDDSSHVGDRFWTYCSGDGDLFEFGGDFCALSFDAEGVEGCGILLFVVFVVAYFGLVGKFGEGS